MKHLNANLDSTTNIEVSLQSSTRILGLDADNNVIELTATPLPDDGDGSGDMAGDDIDGGGGMGTPVNPAVGTEFCYTLGRNRTSGGAASESVFIEDINSCYEVGNVVLISDPSTNAGTGSDTTITTVVTSITPDIDPPLAAPAYNGAGADANGLEGGDALWYNPFTEYYSWEVVSETTGSGGSNSSGYGWTWIDWGWEFPNSTGVFDNPNIFNLFDEAGDPFTSDGRDISYASAGTILYGRFAGDYSGNSATWNSTANGSTVSLNFGSNHGTIVLRKISTLTTHPQPQLWVSTGGFSCYCVYPPFSSSFNSTYAFTSGNTGSIRMGTGTAQGIGSWYPTVKADGTRNGIPGLIRQNGLADYTDLNDITTDQSRISTGSGAPSQAGRFGWRFAGGTWQYNSATSNWENIVTDGSAPTHIDSFSLPYLGDTISDSNRANFFGAIPDNGYYLNPGSAVVLGSFRPGGGIGDDSAAGGSPETSEVEICVEVVSLDTLADPYTFPVTGNSYDFNPLCPAPDDSDDMSDGNGGIDTRVCEDKQIGQTAGIRAYSTGTTQLTTGTDLTSATISSIDLDLTGLDDLRVLTASTTLEDVEDGSISVTIGDASFVAGYSSAALNGNVLTLAGDITTTGATPETFDADYNIGGNFVAFIEQDSFNDDGSIGASLDALRDGRTLTDFFTTGTTNPGYFTANGSDGLDLRNAIIAIAGDINITTADQLQELPSPIQISYQQNNAGFEANIVFNVNSIRRNEPGLISVGNQGGFTLGGSATNNFRITNADIVGTPTGSLFTFNGGSVTIEVGGQTTTIGNLTLTNGVGEWTVPGTAQVCLDGEGGDVNVGGDLNVGGDECISGDLKVGGGLNIEEGLDVAGATCTGGELFIFEYTTGVLEFSNQVLNGDGFLMTFDTTNSFFFDSPTTSPIVGDFVQIVNRNSPSSRRGIYVISAVDVANTTVSYTRVSGALPPPVNSESISISFGANCIDGDGIVLNGFIRLTGELVIGRGTLTLSDGDDRSLLTTTTELALASTSIGTTGTTAAPLILGVKENGELTTANISGGVSGTAGTIPVFDATDDGVGNSIITQQGTTGVTVTGDLTVTGDNVTFGTFNIGNTNDNVNVQFNALNYNVSSTGANFSDAEGSSAGFNVNSTGNTSIGGNFNSFSGSGQTTIGRTSSNTILRGLETRLDAVTSVIEHGTDAAPAILGVGEDGRLQTVNVSAGIDHNLTGTNIVPFWDGDSLENSPITATAGGGSNANVTLSEYDTLTINAAGDGTVSGLPTTNGVAFLQFNLTSATGFTNGDIFGSLTFNLVNPINGESSPVFTGRWVYLDAQGTGPDGQNTSISEAILYQDLGNGVSTLLDDSGNVNFSTDFGLLTATDFNSITAGVTPGSATVTGDLTVTGSITGTLNNVNASGVDFQIWAGTQAEFDAQFSADGLGGDPGTEAADMTGATIYIIR